MPVRLRVRAEGFDRVRGILRGQQRRGSSFVRGISSLVVADLQNTIRQYFRRQGGPYGSWQPLAASTVARKGHSTILWETGRLMRSLWGVTPDSIRDESALRLRFGTRVPYAKFHETGTQHMPARNFMVQGQDARKAADFAARRAVEHVLRLTPGSLGRVR